MYTLDNYDNTGGVSALTVIYVPANLELYCTLQGNYE